MGGADLMPVSLRKREAHQKTPGARESHSERSSAPAAAAADAAAADDDDDDDDDGDDCNPRLQNDSLRPLSSGGTSTARVASSLAYRPAAAGVATDGPVTEFAPLDALLPIPVDGVITGVGNGAAAGVTIPKPTPGKRGGGFSCHCCFHPSMALLKANGELVRACDVVAGDLLLDEYGRPVPVHSARQAYTLQAQAADSVAPAIAVQAIDPACGLPYPAKQMYHFEHANDGGATLPPLIVTDDHTIELINASLIEVKVVSGKLAVSYSSVWHEGQTGGKPSNLVDGARSWPWQRQLTTPLKATYPRNPQNVASDEVRACRWLWKVHNIRAPFFWSPSARDYHDWLWAMHSHFKNDGSAWAMYCPSAVSQFTGSVQSVFGGPFPLLPLKTGLPVIRTLVQPISFTGGGRFRHIAMQACFSKVGQAAAAAAGVNLLDWVDPVTKVVVADGLVEQLAWLVGIWMVVGTTGCLVISQLGRDRPLSQVDVTTGNHSEAIDRVVEIACQVWRAQSVFISPTETQLLSHSAGVWGPAHVAACKREVLTATSRSFHPRKWRLLPALQDDAVNWFSMLLTTLDIYRRKVIPMELLADTVSVRRHLLAGRFLFLRSTWLAISNAVLRFC
jgi:hypothetical protein